MKSGLRPEHARKNSDTKAKWSRPLLLSGSSAFALALAPLLGNIWLQRVSAQTIITSGSGEHGQTADNTTVNSSGAAIYTGVRVDVNGVPVLADGVTPAPSPNDYVSSGATGSHGAYALNGGQMRLNVDATGTATGASGIIQTLGSSSDGVRAEGSGSLLTGANEAILTKGQGSIGAHAIGGGGINLTIGSIETRGLASDGLRAEGANSTINATTQTIVLGGRFGSGAYALDGGRINLTGGSITTTNTDGQGANAVGLRAESAGIITTFGTAVTTSGSGSHGAVANTSGIVTLGGDATSRTTITVNSGNSRGLQATGGTINASFTDVVSGGHGAIAQEAGHIHFGESVTISVNGANTVGLGANDTGRIDGSASTIVNMQSASPGQTAAYAHDGGQIALGPGSVFNITNGPGVGMTVDNTALAAPTAGLTVNLNSTSAAGSSGIVALNGGTASFDTLTVSGSGAGSGVFARDAGSHVTLTGNSRISITAGSPNFYEMTSTGFLLLSTGFISTASAPAHGLSARNGANVSSTGTDISVTVQQGVGAYALRGGTIDLVGNDITTTGAYTAGLQAVYGTITARDSTVSVDGGSAGVVLASDELAPVAGTNSVVGITNTTVTATNGAFGLYSRNFNGETPNSFTMSGGSLSSATASAFGGSGRTDIALSNGAAAQGPYLLIAYGQNAYRNAQTGVVPAFLDTVINFSATGAARLTGDSVLTSGCIRDSASNCLSETFATANVTLDQSTILTGAFATRTGNTGNMTLLGSSVWNLTASSNLTNLTNNFSSILYAAPTADPTLPSSYKTLTTVNYTGQSGLIGLNTFLEGDGSPSDLLVIDGGTASGVSNLRITNTAGAGAVTQGNGILLVDAANGANTLPGAFALAAPTIAGPYEYTLHRGGLDGSAPESWFLRNTLQPSPTPTPTPGPSPTPPTPPTPHYRQEASIYAAAPALMTIYGRLILDTLHERVGEEEQLRGNLPRAGSSELAKGMWGRILYRDGKSDGDPLGIYGGSGDGPSYDSDMIAFQMGLDVYRHQARDANGNEGARDHVGIMGTYGGIDANVDHNLLAQRFPAGRIRMESWSLGAFWTHFTPKGAYLDLVGQATFHDIKLQSLRLPEIKTDGFGLALSAEGGYPVRLGENWLLEPQAQLVYQTLGIDDFTDPGARVRFRDLDSLAGRIGLRLANARGEAVGDTQGWLRGNIWHEFLGSPRTEFSSADDFVPFHANPPETWWQLGLGGSVLIDSRVTLYGQGNYEAAFDGDSHAWSLKAGMRFSF